MFGFLPLHSLQQLEPLNVTGRDQRTVCDSRYLATAKLQLYLVELLVIKTLLERGRENFLLTFDLFST